MIEIIAFGSAEMLRNVLDGVAMLSTGSGNFDVAAIAKMGMLIGILMLGFNAVTTQRIEAEKLILGLLFFFIMFVPKVTVSIYDPYTGVSKTVANVPIGVAAPMSIISQTGNWLTEAFELAYNNPEAKLENGYLSSLQIILKSRNARAPIDLPLEKSVQNYMEGCVIYNMGDEYDDARITEEKLLAAPSVLAAIETSYVNRDVIIFQSGNTPVQRSCKQAYDYLLDTVTSFSFRNAWSKSLKSQLNVTADKGTTAEEDVEAALKALGNVSEDGQKYMLNAFLGNMYKCASVSECSMLTQAQEQRRVQMASEQNAFQQMARPIMAFMEAFIPALAPLMALMATLGPIGSSMIMKYFMALVWIAMWQPMMALVNMYIVNAASGEIARITASGIEVSSLTGMDSTWTTIADSVAVGGMLASSVPALAAMVVFGASAASSRMSSFGSSSSGSSEAAPSLTKVSAAYEQGSAFTNNSGQVASFGAGTAGAGVSAGAAGTIGAVASQVAATSSGAANAVAATTAQTESARSSFISSASDTAASQIAHATATTDSAGWKNSQSSTKSTSEQLGKKFGWDEKQTHGFDAAVQVANGLVTGGKMSKQDAPGFVAQTMEKMGLSSKGQLSGRADGKAGTSGDISEGLTSGINSALAAASSASSERGGGISVSDTATTSKTVAKIAQSQQSKDYSEAKSRQQSATDSYNRTSTWQNGVSQGANYGYGELSGIIGRNPEMSKQVESLASTLTPNQLKQAESGLKSAGIYGVGGSPNNIDQNIVRAKALADNGKGAELLGVLRDGGVISPATLNGNGMSPDSNAGLANQNPGLGQERSNTVSIQAGAGGNAGLKANQHHGAPPPEAPSTSSTSGASSGSGASSAPRSSSKSPGGGGRHGGHVPPSSPASPSQPSAVDAAHQKYQANFEQQKQGLSLDSGAVYGYQPTEQTKKEGKSTVMKAAPSAAGEAVSRAAQTVMNDINKLSKGEVIGAAAMMAAPIVAGAAFNSAGQKAIQGAAQTQAGRAALGKALAQVAGKRGAAWAATAAVGSTGIGVPVAAVMTVGNIALTARDVYDVYQIMGGNLPGGAGSPTGTPAGTGTTVPGSNSPTPHAPARKIR